MGHNKIGEVVSVVFKVNLLKKAVPMASVAVVTGALFAVAAFAQGGAAVTGNYGYGCGSYEGTYGHGTYSGVYKKCRPSGGGGGGTPTPTPTPTPDPTPTPTPVTPGTSGTVISADGQVSAAIPANVLTSGTNVTAAFSALTEADATKIKADVLALFTRNSKAPTTLTVAAPGVVFTITADGKTVAEFNAPVTFTVKLNAGIDSEFVQAFLQKEDGTLVAVRTHAGPNGTVRVAATGSGKYVFLAADRQFSDVAAHWAKREVGVMAAHMLVDGYPEGNFLPNGNVSRAEFVAMLVRSIGLKETGAKAAFADVAGDAWYSTVVRTAVDAGLVNGMDANNFAPSAQISREQMMALLGRAARNAKLATGAGGLGKFADAGDLSGWAATDVRSAFEAGLVKGEQVGENSFKLNPSSNSTRAESATILYRLFGKVE